MGRVLGPDEDLRRAGREVFGYYGQYWAELLWLQAHGLKVNSIPTIVDGIEELRKAKAASRGMILAMPHLGSWAVLGFLARQEQIEITVVAEFLPERRMRDWFLKLRRGLGMEVLDAGRDGVSTSALAKRLRTGGAIVLITDRDLRGTGVPVVFFGEETTLPDGPATLAELTGAPIFPVADYFLPGGGHRLVIQKPLAPTTTGSLEQRLRLRTQRLAQSLEILIRQAPTQWHLVRPNWPSDR
jgi:lauroyl/myristoyl acyltransferase